MDSSSTPTNNVTAKEMNLNIFAFVVCIGILWYLLWQGIFTCIPLKINKMYLESNKRLINCYCQCSVNVQHYHHELTPILLKSLCSPIWIIVQLSTSLVLLVKNLFCRFYESEFGKTEVIKMIPNEVVLPACDQCTVHPNECYFRFPP